MTSLNTPVIQVSPSMQIAYSHLPVSLNTTGFVSMHKPISNLSSSSNNSHSDGSRSSNCVYLPGKASVISLKLPEEGHHLASSRSVASDGLAYVVGPDTEVGGGVYDHS